MNARLRSAGLLAVGAVVVAALVPGIRLIALAALLAALLIARPWPDVVRVVAAAIPAAVYLAWGALPQPSTADIVWCGEVLSPPVLRQVGGALVVFAAVGLLARRLRPSGEELGFMRPSPKLIFVSLLVAVAVAVGSLALGTTLAAPFFGTVELKVDDPRAIIPAVILATASGSMQEVAFRGAMLGWLTPGLGARTALLAQAVAFGAAHIGPDFVTSPLPVMIAVGAGGVVAGYIVQRYRSLTFPTVVHAGFDIPLYFVAACRLA